MDVNSGLFGAIFGASVYHLVIVKNNLVRYS